MGGKWRAAKDSNLLPPSGAEESIILMAKALPRDSCGQQAGECGQHIPPTKGRAEYKVSGGGREPPGWAKEMGWEGAGEVIPFVEHFPHQSLETPASR